MELKKNTTPPRKTEDNGGVMLMLVIFILAGHGTIVEKEPGAESEIVSPVAPGDCLYCPKGHSHSLQNTSEEGDLVFYAVVPKQ